MSVVECFFNFIVRPSAVIRGPINVPQKICLLRPPTAPVIPHPESRFILGTDVVYEGMIV